MDNRYVHIKTTKRPKRTKVTWVETKSYYSNYHCPSCHTQYQGGLNRSTTRFKCDCGQELIVDE
jgi:hypothetical protein